ncbi:uncharacterized protein [Anabrus simplex]|uniref:uncharacterized protein n=1 Tax=Anabrus simplex TaxID=316456 RepID=UPI0035A33D82
MKKETTNVKKGKVEMGLKGEMLLVAAVITVLLVISVVEVNSGPNTSGNMKWEGVEVIRNVVKELSVSNESLVVLRKVGFNLSGNFSCEVTVDAPSFSTKTVTEQMLVVALPESPPVIETERDRYDPGDILRANCTSPPSKPAASLSFLLNNIPVGVPDLRRYKAEDSLHSSALSLTMQLFPSHYSNGELVLKCTAYLSSLYRETTEVHLGSRAREPVPERVTSPNGTASTRLSAAFHLLLLVIGCYAAR